jgi:hypothetical protein
MNLNLSKFAGDVKNNLSNLVSTRIKSTQQGLQNWAQKNPTQATNIVKIPDAIQTYGQEVKYNKENPFFNEQNTPAQWVNRVVQEFKQRGPAEGIHGLTNPILMSPYVEPIAERVVSGARVANYKAGRPNQLVNKILGQTDEKMMKPPVRKTTGPEIYPNLEYLDAFPSFNDKKQKTMVNQQIQQYKNKVKNPQAFVVNLFNHQELNPEYYWYIYKSVVPNAQPQDFVNAIKSYINTYEPTQ